MVRCFGMAGPEHRAAHRRSETAPMSDAVDRLAQALRDLINEAVQQAVQEAVARRPAPRDTPHVRGHAPGDLVDEEIRQEYEKRFGEPAPKVWGERRLISVAEARQQLGGIGHYHVLFAGQERRTVAR